MHTLLTPGQNGFLLTDIGRLINKLFELKAKDVGISRPQWHILAYLTNTPGLTQVALAHLMDVEPITMSRQLDRMEKEGWLERRSDPNDRRVKRLYLTAQAGPLLRQVETVRDDVLALIFAGVPKEHEDMFRAVLAIIHKNLLANL